MSQNSPHPSENESTNKLLPVLIFLGLLFGPYLLFALVLMLLTGKADVVLLYNSVMRESDTFLVKSWVIGSFILSILGTFIITSIQTKQLIALQRRQLREDKFNRVRDREHGFMFDNAENASDNPNSGRA